MQDSSPISQTTAPTCKMAPGSQQPRTVWILGTRGIPNRYGGFEALAQEVTHEIVEGGGRCVVLANTTSQRNSNPTLKLLLLLFPNLQTPLLTWINSRMIMQNVGDHVLVTNPVNVLVALRLSRRNLVVALHLDGLEDRRKKWHMAHRIAHRLARWLAVRSDLALVSDSEAIQTWYQAKYDRVTSFIPYGGCRQAHRDISHRWRHIRSPKFLVIARPVPENHTLEILQAFRFSRNQGQLEVIGGPTRTDRYWKEICDEAERNPRVNLRGAVWERSEICRAILSSSALIHGHSVGGTNPSLVDAASHGIPIIAHDNLFNREVLNDRGMFWSDLESLANLLAKSDLVPVQPDVSDCHNRYQWTQVASSYLNLFRRLSEVQS